MIHTFFDFCSGIGAGRLGLEQCGLKCVGYSDTSRLAETTYKLLHNTEGEKNYGNLKRIKYETLPKFDVLIAGFPCQTFSVMGRQEGFSDDRGQIIFHLADILKHSKPDCFILENVKGLVSHDNGKTIKTILSSLNESGFDTSYRVLVSLDHGVPQMRQRVYFVGFRKDLKYNYKNYKWPDPIPMPSLDGFLVCDKIATEENIEIFKRYLLNEKNNGKYSIEVLKTMNNKILDTRMNDLRIYDRKIPTLRAQRDGIYYVMNNTIYQLTGYEALLVQGFPKEYADKVKDIVSDRHLLMQAGNAMTVNVIKELGKSIKNFIKGEENG